MFTLRKFATIINPMNIRKRNLMWVDTELDNPNILKLGVTEKTVKEFGKINDIKISKDNTVMFNQELIIIENDLMMKYYTAPYDCMIIERNNNVNINISPENHNNWIIKIIPLMEDYIEQYYY